MRTIIAVLIVVAVAGVPCGFATDEVGRIKVVEGDAALVRGDVILTPQPGNEVQTADVLTTGDDGKLGVILADDTVISLGPSSEFSVTEFQFSPREDKLSFVGKMARGTCSFLSGIITKLSPERSRIETPDATIGIRGTRLLIEVQPK